MTAPATAQPLKLEVGGVYRTRDGRRAVITEVDQVEGWRRGYVDREFIGWHPTGEFELNKIEQSPLDLIAEWDAPDADGWIQWSGGECPVPPETVVEVKYDDGEITEPDKASTWDWECGWPEGCNIVAYRVVTPAPEEAPKPSTLPTGDLKATPLAEVGVDPASPGGDQTCVTFMGESARRAIACWNACRGVSTEELEAGATPSLDEADARAAAHFEDVLALRKKLAERTMLAKEMAVACQKAKKRLEPDLVEPGRTVFWELVAVLDKARAAGLV